MAGGGGRRGVKECGGGAALVRCRVRGSERTRSHLAQTVWKINRDPFETHADPGAQPYNTFLNLYPP